MENASIGIKWAIKTQSGLRKICVSCQGVNTVMDNSAPRNAFATLHDIHYVVFSFLALLRVIMTMLVPISAAHRQQL